MGGVAGQQRGDLLVRARFPQSVQQAGYVVRVVEGGVGDGLARGAGVRTQASRRIVDEVEDGADVTGCGGVLCSWAASRYRPRAWAAAPSAAWSPSGACTAAADQNAAGGIWLARCARPYWSR